RLARVWVRAVRFGLDEDDVGLGRDGVGPLHVQGRLQVPVVAGGRLDMAAGQVHLGEGAVAALAVELGQTVPGAEGAEVAGNGGVPVGIDVGDGLARAVPRDRARAVGERDLVEPVGGLDLRGDVVPREQCAWFQLLNQQAGTEATGQTLAPGAVPGERQAV